MFGSKITVQFSIQRVVQEGILEAIYILQE